MPRLLLLLATLALAGPGARAAAPPPTMQVTTAQVTAVPDGETLVVEDGREVRLVGIRAPLADPQGSVARGPEPLAAAARTALAGLAQGQSVQLRYPGPPTDRYGRLLADAVLADGRSLRRELVRLGLARVYVDAGHRDGAAALLADEDAARRARRGLWALSVYRVRTPAEAAAEPPAFVVVAGQVQTARLREGVAYLDFGPDYRSDLAVVVPHQAVRAFRGAGIDLGALAARWIRVRGFLDHRGGPVIETTVPEQLELLPDPVN